MFFSAHKLLRGDELYSEFFFLYVSHVRALQCSVQGRKSFPFYFLGSVSGLRVKFDVRQEKNIKFNYIYTHRSPTKTCISKGGQILNLDVILSWGKGWGLGFQVGALWETIKRRWAEEMHGQHSLPHHADKLFRYKSDL